MNRIHPSARSMFWATLVGLMVCVMPVGASAALKAYMTAVGEVQGVITGGVTQAGREGSIEIVEFGHSVSAPVTEGGYQPAGPVQHRAIRVTKPLDEASTVLMRVMASGEKLTNVTIRFFRPLQTGAEQQYYTVELVNAYIVNISQSNRSVDDSWNVVAAPGNETLAITYERIIWTWEPSGWTTEDTWIDLRP